MSLFPDDWLPLPSGNRFYILNPDHSVTQCDMMTWALWYEDRERCIVLQTAGRLMRDSIDLGELRVSTVFLGLDHSYTGSTGPPLIFETMVFGEAGWEEYACVRYSTWDEAVAGHQKMIESIPDFVPFEWTPETIDKHTPEEE